MKQIAEIREQDVNPYSPSIDESAFRIREAVRAIVTDKDGKVALLHVGKHDYHKLPGGGIDESEDIPTALARELMEEIGCRAEVLNEVGEIIEHRNKFEMIQKSYCFTAKLLGDKGQPDFTESELANQFSIVWADNLSAAIDLLQKNNPNDYEGRFIKIRDSAFLQAVQREDSGSNQLG